MKKSNVYTKTGDAGTTSLVGGTRIPKNHIRLEAYGTVDELNSFLGLLRSQEIGEDDKKNILRIQNELFLVGATLATEDSDTSKCTISQEDIKWLETEIDTMDEKLPPLKNFIIPADIQAVSFCHVCRTVCRRAERVIFTLSEQHPVPELISIYMNRLSDYLFVLSRKISYSYDKSDFFFNNNCK
jgi:cob(I)alamin adenosyltransferase